MSIIARKEDGTIIQCVLRAIRDSAFPELPDPPSTTAFLRGALAGTILRRLSLDDSYFCDRW